MPAYDEVLQNSPFFDGLTTAHLSSISSYTELVDFKDNQVIIKEGTPSDFLYILKGGTLRVEKETSKAPIFLNTLHEPGTFFGEMSLVDILPHSTTVRSSGPSTLLRFHKRDLTIFFTEHPETQLIIILNIARILSHRLRAAGERIVALST